MLQMLRIGFIPRTFGDAPPLEDEGLGEVDEACQVRTLEMLLADPAELLLVEDGARLVDAGDGELLDELANREDLLVAVRPTEAGKEVDHCLGQVAGVSVLEERGRTMPFGELLPIVPKQHRNVRKSWHWLPECLEEKDVLGRVVQVIIAADDVADLHVRIVNDDGEVVDETPVGTANHEVLEMIVPIDDVAE